MVDTHTQNEKHNVWVANGMKSDAVAVDGKQMGNKS